MMDPVAAVPFPCRRLFTWWLAFSACRSGERCATGECCYLLPLPVYAISFMAPESFAVRSSSIPPIPDPVPTPPLPFALSTLEIDLCKDPPPPGLLEALFTASSHSLELLTLVASEADTLEEEDVSSVFSSIVPVFPLVAACLRHLSFPTFPSPTAFNPLLSACTSLDAVTIVFKPPGDHDYDRDTGITEADAEANMAVVQSTVNALPPSVVRLTLDVQSAPFPYLMPELALHIISSSVLASLQRVDFVGGLGLGIAWRELERADAFFAECERRGILVVCDGEWA